MKIHSLPKKIYMKHYTIQYEIIMQYIKYMNSSKNKVDFALVESACG